MFKREFADVVQSHGFLEGGLDLDIFSLKPQEAFLYNPALCYFLNILLQEEEVQIDCENRIHLCKASCCRLSFPLSMQDINEGIVKWDLRSPYLIAQDTEGDCQHIDRGTCHCTIRDHRPVPCRAYDCRNDPRIWVDFDNQIVNPDIDDLFQKNNSAS